MLISQIQINLNLNMKNIKLILFLFAALVSSSYARSFYDGWITNDQKFRSIFQGYVNGDQKPDGFGLQAPSVFSHFPNTNEKVDFYSGMFVNGRRKGYGQFLSDNGSYTYYGQVNDSPNGFGVQHQISDDEESASLYIGNFKNGKYHGSGWLLTSTSTNEVQVGTFENGRFKSGQTIYRKRYSTIESLKPLAYLYEVLENKDIYVLTYKKGQIDGQGRYSLSNGEHAFGYFRERNGKLSQYGKGYKQNDEYLHIGEWGLSRSFGYRYYSNDTVQIGQWGSQNTKFLSGDQFQVDFGDFVDLVNNQHLKQIFIAILS